MPVVTGSSELSVALYPSESSHQGGKRDEVCKISVECKSYSSCVNGVSMVCLQKMGWTDEVMENEYFRSKLDATLDCTG